MRKGRMAGYGPADDANGGPVGAVVLKHITADTKDRRC
jgi:hypothetical protein